MIVLEFKQCWREAGVRLTLLFVLVLLILAIAQGHAHVQRTMQALAGTAEHQAEFLASARQRVAEVDRVGATAAPAPDPRDVANFSGTQLVNYARFTPAPLAALSVGQSELFPAYIALNTGSRDKTMGSAEIANPERMQTGTLDLAFVLVYLLPLAMIVLGFGVRATERETGVDVLVRLSSAEAWRVYVRRLALRALMLYGLVIVVMLVAAGMGMFLSTAWGDLWQAFGLIAAYLLFWCAVVMAVAMNSATSAISALRALAVWIVLLVLVPAAANVSARMVAPVPSRAEFVQAVRDATDAVEAERAGLLDKYMFDHPEMLGDNANTSAIPAAITSLVTRRAVEARAQAVDMRYRDQLNRQEAVIAKFEWLSPGMWLQNALNRLAGTDTTRYRQFLEQVTAYHEELRSFFEVLLRRPQGAASNYAPEVAGDREHFHFPVYAAVTPRQPTLGAFSSYLALLLSLLASAGLILWTRQRRDLL